MPKRKAFALQSAVADSPMQAPVRIPRKHGRKSSKRSADLSPRSTLGRRPCSSRCREFRKRGCHAFVDVRQKAALCRCAICRPEAEHRTNISQATSAPSAIAADCCQWPSPRSGPRTMRAEAPLRAPLRSETLSDSPAKCSCDVRPVKVKPESKYEYTFRSGLTLTHGQGPAWVGPDGHNPRRERFSFPAIFFPAPSGSNSPRLFFSSRSSEIENPEGQRFCFFALRCLALCFERGVRNGTGQWRAECSLLLSS